MNPKGDDLTPGKIIFSKYLLDKKLGEGSFGKIFTATNTRENHQYALKFEKRSQSSLMLEAEAQFMSHLKGFGIPEAKSFGVSGSYNVLVMELLGKSLEEYFQEREKRYSIKTTCMVGIQMIERLKFVHSKDLLHRDIKPDNFCFGLGNKSHIVYLIDFGLSKKYRSTTTGEHIRFGENKKLTGTARYASINALRGYEQSRRDDLEAIGYVMMYFLRGSLPWQGLKVQRNVDRYRKIFEKKQATTPEDLCEGFPDEFIDYVSYTRGLNFEDEPNYDYLQGLMLSAITDQGLENDYLYDWSVAKPDLNAMNEIIKQTEDHDFEMLAKEEEEPDKDNNQHSSIANKKDNNKVLNTQEAQYNVSIPTLGDEKKQKGDKEMNKKKDKKDKKEKDPNKKKICIIY